MKNFNTITKWALTLAVAVFSALSLSAQPQDDGDMPGNNPEFWKKAQTEKQDFIVRRLGLKKAEKKAFLKIYKENEEERGRLFSARKEAYNALKDAVKKQEESEETIDIQPLLQAYLDARESLEAWENSDWQRFSEVLSTDDVAKLLVAEEDYRKAQIHRLGGRQGGAPGQGGPGQGGPGGQGDPGGFGGGRPPMGGGPGGMPF